MNFIRDVNPVLTRLGCNQGTCHGAKDGKNGFKLSLRGYDPIYDVAAFTDEIKSRRTNTASPDDSLMLLKASGAVPHVGGQLTRPGEASYEIIRRWIAEGAKLEQNIERVESIEIEPYNPVVQDIGARQQLRVMATYSNGTKRDVTGNAFLESGNTEVAEGNRSGVITAIRRGEAPILARFEGSYAATTLTVMGDRTGFVWEEPETWSKLDQLVAEKWERMKIAPSPLCDDAEFLRRIHLDLTGLPPSADEVLAFTNDTRPTREKRDEVIDRLIGSSAYIDYWTNKWADMLQVNGKFLGGEGAALFRSWIRAKVEANEPYDKFCYDVITASGSNKSNPPASYFKILREPDALLENSTHLFLAIRFNCNKCHDHPFERWTQDQYFQTGAYFAQINLARDPNNAEGNIGGSAVEGEKPLWESVSDNSTGELKHDRTGAVTSPMVPYDREIPVPDSVSRREQLAEWITSADNSYFARSYVNRVWGYLTGVGLIEPIDDIRAGNPASNPELLDYLTEEFIQSNFDVRKLMALICKSRTYQLSIATNKWNDDDHLNYSHATPKRLPAEVLYDTVYTATGSKMHIPGVPEGTRAAALPDVQLNLQDGFLDNLGRPVRESSCECERSSELQLGPVMALMNGVTVSEAISQPGNRLEQLVNSEPDNPALINKVFLNLLNRPATPGEVAATLELLDGLDPELQKVIAQRDAYAEEIKPVLHAQHQAWLAKLEESKKQLQDYQIAMQPAVAAAELAREQSIAAAQQSIEDYLASASERAKTWTGEEIKSLTPWEHLVYSEMVATNEATLTMKDDQSVLASGKNGKGKYILSSTATLNHARWLKLEVLADPSLPGQGPGRLGGNFVLTELVLEVWPKGEPEQVQVVRMKNTTASFSQANYPISAAIDGETENVNNGWALSPEVGKNQHAFFEFESPISLQGEMEIRITMHQNYADGNHSIGRFRIGLSDAEGNLNLGIQRAIAEIAAIPGDQRSPEQLNIVAAYQNLQDQELIAHRNALEAANRPLPADPKLEELKASLVESEKPVPPDPRMVRLDRAVALGQEQLTRSRLTAIQDLAWALINSPAFLFNH